MSRLSRRRLLQLGLVAGAAACTPSNPTATPTASPTPEASSGPSSPAAAVTPSPTPTPTPTSTPGVDVPLVCRDAWGASPPGDGMTPHRVARLTVHHSAAAATDLTQGPGHLRGYQRYHVDTQGWPDIAYHVAVDRTGVAYDLRDWSRVGDTGTEYDPTGHFLLLLDGNFDTHDVTDAQFDTASRLLAWASTHFEVGLDTVSGHRDHAATSCPGDALYRRLGELVDAASNWLDAGGVTLTQACGPEVDTAVAALEDGARAAPPLIASPA